MSNKELLEVVITRMTQLNNGAWISSNHFVTHPRQQFIVIFGLSINAFLFFFLDFPCLKKSQLHPMLPYKVLKNLAWLVIWVDLMISSITKDARLDFTKGWEEETSSKLWLWTLQNVWTWTILESFIARAVTFQGHWAIVQTTVICFGLFLVNEY